MNITLISTKATNIGDDLIRRGVQRLLVDALPGADINWTVVNKHQPWTVYLKSALASTAIERLPRGKRRLTGALGRVSRVSGAPTAFSDADLIVQCGTPVMWHGSGTSEWQEPIWNEALGRPGRAPVMNLSGGSCYPWTAPRPIALDPADKAGIAMMLRRSDMFTARDNIAKEICESLGAACAVFSCAAVHSGGGVPAAEAEGPLLLNVMPRGGHFDWNQRLDPSRWLSAVDQLIAERSGKDTFLFLCHSRDELDLARGRWPAHEAVLPESTDEYLAVARRGRVAVVNRMHAAVVLAGLGVPALGIGTDTRLMMVEQTGQEIAYLGDADGPRLIESVERLDAEQSTRRQSLLQRERDSFAAHLAHLKSSAVLRGLTIDALP
jgi:hypothetical protein